MQKKQYSVDVNASAAKAHDMMLGITDKSTYEQWTAVFNPSSTFEGSWETGSKIYFIGCDENGKRGGMIARIAENTPGKTVSIQHYGILDGDNEITEGPQVDSWAGGFENYYFSEKDGVTQILVEVDVMDEHLDYFENTYPKAMLKLKEVIEGLVR